MSEDALLSKKEYFNFKLLGWFLITNGSSLYFEIPKIKNKMSSTFQTIQYLYYSMYFSF